MSGVVIFFAGVSIWPPGYVYWNVLAARAGFVSTIAVVMVLCAIIGAGIALVSGVSIGNFVIGSGAAYVVGMVPLALVVSPQSAGEYVVVYGTFLCCFVVGVVVARTVRYRWSVHWGWVST